MPWRGPEYPGELPTLGYYVLDWMAEYLVVPDGPLAGEPLVLTAEQAQFVLNFYAIDPRFEGPAIRGAALHNARRIRRAVLSRPKGWGKSPLLAALTLVEALADVVPDGWDADGEPVGRAWTSLGFKAKAQLVAVSEDQTANTWDPLLDMARNGPVLDAYGIEPMQTFVNVPRGLIEYVTASGTSREGFRPVFSVLDQTESWVASNGGIKLAATIRRNIAKVNGSSIETPNAFVPGEKSVAERSFDSWRAQVEGKLRGGDGILFDHREAPPETDPTDRRSLLAGLAYAYGDSADVNGGWVTLERILQDYWDPDTEPQDARHFYLNQITHTSDSWVSQPEWAARVDVEKVIADREVVTLGFDGSRGRTKGKADATTLIGCRVHDGHLFELAVWEQPDGKAGEGWEPPVIEVDAAVDTTFRRLDVIGFFADPTMWDEHVAKWEAKYGSRLKVKATQQHAIRWPKTQITRVVEALKRLRTAIVQGEMTHDGSFAMTRHFLNARERKGRSGVYIAKESPDSPKKIDAAYAGMLAWQARLEAVAAGYGQTQKRAAPRRIR